MISIKPDRSPRCILSEVDDVKVYFACSRIKHVT